MFSARLIRSKINRYPASWSHLGSQEFRELVSNLNSSPNVHVVAHRPVPMITPTPTPRVPPARKIAQNDPGSSTAVHSAYINLEKQWPIFLTIAVTATPLVILYNYSQTHKYDLQQVAQLSSILALADTPLSLNHSAAHFSQIISSSSKSDSLHLFKTINLTPSLIHRFSFSYPLCYFLSVFCEEDNQNSINRQPNPGSSNSAITSEYGDDSLQSSVLENWLSSNDDETEDIDQQQSDTMSYRKKKKALISVALFLSCITAAFVPFLAPAFRKHILPYIPATPDQINQAFQLCRLAFNVQDQSLFPKEILTPVATLASLNPSNIPRISTATITAKATAATIENRTTSNPAAPRKRIIDIGSGDGRVAIQAVQELGVHSTGVELNRWLVWYSRLASLRAKTYRQTAFRCVDLWTHDLGQYDVVFVFAVREMMHALEEKLERELSPHAAVVSTRFALPNWKPYKIAGITFLYFRPEVTSQLVQAQTRSSETQTYS